MGIFSKWETIQEFNDPQMRYKVVKIKKSGKAALVDKATNKIAEGFEDLDKISMVVETFDATIWACQKDGKFAFVDSKANFLTDYNYVAAKSIFELHSLSDQKRFCAQSVNGDWRLLDFKGKDSGHSFQFVDDRSFDWMRRVCVNDERTTGETFFMENKGYPMPHRFQSVEPFVNGMGRCLKKDGTTTFANTEGEVLNLSASYANDFDIDGFAVLTLNGERCYQLVNKKGKVMEDTFDDISDVSRNGRIYERTGYINYEGTNYEVRILNGVVSHEEWLALIKTKSELYSKLPDALFRKSTDVFDFDSVVEVECNKLIKDARKIYGNPKATAKDIDLAESKLNRADMLYNLIRDKKESAKKHNDLEDAKIAEANARRMKTEAEKNKLQAEIKKAKLERIEEERRKSEEEKIKREEEKKEAQRLAKEAEEKERQEILQKKSELAKRMEKYGNGK